MFLVWGLHFENHCHREWKSDPGESFPIGGIFLVCFVDWAVSGYFCLVCSVLFCFSSSF